MFDIFILLIKLWILYIFFYLHYLEIEKKISFLE